MLKLNEDKTEVMLFAPKHRVKDLQDCHLTFGGNVVTSSECVKNLGVYFDKTLSMNQQVSSVSIPAFTGYEILTAYVRTSQRTPVKR